MPRKHNPAWDKDGVVSERDHRYRADFGSVDKAFRLIGVDPDSLSRMRLRLEASWIGSGFLRWRASNATSVSRASARAAISDTLELETIRAAHVNALNIRAADAVFNALMLDELTKPEPAGTKMDLWAADALTDADWRRILGTADAALKAQKGPDPAIETAIAVGRLVRLYAALTGRRARRNNTGPMRSYSQRSRSDAGAFVTFWMQRFDPDLRDETISGALKKTLARRNRPTSP